MVVELRVLDRLRDLARDGHEQVDLVGPELARRLGADVEGALEPLLREDRDGEDRLVLLLAQVGKAFEPGIEMGRARDHHRRPSGRRRARDPLARAHLGHAGQLFHARPVRGPQDELVRGLVVEVDEARIGLERLGHLVRDQLEDLVEVERRVDGRDRLGQQPQMAGGAVHVI